MKRFILAITLTLPLSAQDPSSILAKSDVYRNPLDSFSIDVELTSHEKGRTSTSRFRVHGKGTDRSVVEFVAPATEKGKFLLMLRDAMWIYMPSASRPIRISPLQRLMGQASNGDVARTSFTVDYVAKSASEDGDAWLIELEAKDPSIAYKRVRLWIDRTSYEPRRADFYVASGKLLKRAHYRELGVMNGSRTITLVEIEDLLRAGNRTVMRYSNLVARDHSDKMFTRDALGRW
jgi:outer membrane lipoprotein-sorting protein